jgi:hypothetical protein
VHTVNPPARPEHAPAPPAPLTSEQVAVDLVPVAAELVGIVHDHGPHAYADVFARVPADQWHALAVVLAAMVDPSRRVSELLAWTHHPARSLDGTDYDINPTAPWEHRRKACRDCGEIVLARHMGRHRRRAHADADTQAA